MWKIIKLVESMKHAEASAICGNLRKIIAHRLSIRIVGRAGCTVHAKWSINGPSNAPWSCGRRAASFFECLFECISCASKPISQNNTDSKCGRCASPWPCPACHRRLAMACRARPHRATDAVACHAAAIARHRPLPMWREVACFGMELACAFPDIPGLNPGYSLRGRTSHDVQSHAFRRSPDDRCGQAHFRRLQQACLPPARINSGQCCPHMQILR